MNGLGGVATLIGVPYFAIMLLLVMQQRSLIFPRPGQLAQKRDHNGGRLITLPTPASADTEGLDLGTTLAALYFPAPASDGHVIVYFHGNADQIGWGGAYVGALFRERQLGVLAVEYPGYGHAKEGVSEPSEEAMYKAAELMVLHLTSPTDEGGLGVPASSVVLMGQSIGGAVAVELAARGHGVALLLLSPFASLPKMVDAVFPIVTPALRIFPWVLKDKFDNLRKAEQGLVSPTNGGHKKHGLPVLL